jgi:CRP/FNR family transcriptional activator FtrB
MRKSDAQEIRRLELFRSARQATFQALVRGAFLQWFPPGVVLIREGDPADFMCLLVEGRVELYASAQRRQTTLSIAEPGQTLVLAAILADRVYLQSGRTLEASRILLVPAEAVRGAIAEDAGFANALLREAALRYREIIRELKDLKLRGGVERLANWLLRASDAAGCAAVIELDIEKRLLASRLGMTPENLSRAFQSLAHHGVATSGARIEIFDRAALVRYAHPAPLIDDREA